MNIQIGIPIFHLDCRPPPMGAAMVSASGRDELGIPAFLLTDSYKLTHPAMHPPAQQVIAAKISLPIKCN